MTVRVKFRLQRVVGVGCVLAVALSCGIATAVPAAAQEGQILNAGAPDAITNSYLVVFRNSVSAQGIDGQVSGLTAEYGAQVRHVFRMALHGFAATMSEKAARRLAADPAVAYVQQDRVAWILDTQPNPPSWGLDRINQPDLPLDQSYTYDTTASNVHAYVIDTGIRIAHQSFGGRAVWGANTTGDGNNSDCNGHGTHVGGTIGGTQYGVAKGVRLVAVKVLNCAGSGSISGIVAGIDWVTRHAVKPAVANISFGASGSDPAMENAIRNSIASGVAYVVASGNSNADACNFTPARVPEAITVNASDINDNRATFSNFGRCTDLFAPGVNITSTWNTSDSAANTISGTSMSSAHTSGAAALLLSQQPSSTAVSIVSELARGIAQINNWTSMLHAREIVQLTYWIVYYETSEAPTFRAAINSGVANWNSKVSRVKLRAGSTPATLHFQEGDDPRGSYADTDGRGNGTIFIDYHQATIYDRVRIAAHETGHALGLADHYEGPCSELMSGGGPGPSCTNAYPNSAEATWVNSLWFNGPGIAGQVERIYETNLLKAGVRVQIPSGLHRLVSPFH